MFSTLKLYKALAPKERREAVYITVLLIFTSVLDAFGIAALMPFLGALSNPEFIASNKFSHELYDLFQFQSESAFLFTMGVGILLLQLVVMFCRITSVALTQRFVFKLECSLAVMLHDRYLMQPYSWYLRKNSSELSKTILAEVGTTVGHGVMPTMTLVAQGSAVVMIMIVLVMIDPLVALSIAASITLVYMAIYVSVSRRLLYFGRERAKANQKRYQYVNECFQAIKYIKKDGTEGHYSKKFYDASSSFATNTASAQIASVLPRYLVETLVICGVMVTILFHLNNNSELSALLPILGLYLFAGYRLMPAMQQLYSSLAQLKFGKTVAERIVSELNDLGVAEKAATSSLPTVINCEHEIRLENIYYSHDKGEKATLSDVNISIKSKACVGIVGSSGSGKSTLIDILVGLIKPDSGRLTVDGKNIDNKNITDWSYSVGYVPQEIYLSDDTVESNIAFGVDARDIDHTRVVEAARIAGIDSFISEGLNEGYKTLVGERGVRLSGGQRQRIGIARALYRRPSILVFDEATSALDNQTEKTVMEAVYNLRRRVTIIVIAHRISTVKDCDEIIFLEDGAVTCSNSFEELYESNNKFRQFVGVSN